MIDLLSIGNAKIDVFVILNNLNNFTYDKFSNQISFPLGSKISFGDHPLTLGGNACNVSVAGTKLGLNSALIAGIGKDEFSTKILNDLKQFGVNTEYLTISESHNPTFNIALSFQGERTILEEESQESVTLNIPNLNPKLIYLTSVTGDWQVIFNNAIANNANSMLAMNPGSKMLEENLEEVIEILPKIKYLFVNLQEAQRITKDSNPDIKIILQKLKALGCTNAIITDGINGSYAIDAEENAYQIGTVNDEKPVEKTGAGDSYASGFIYAILKERSVPDAMKFGAINANSVISKVGAQAGLLTESQIEEEAKNNTGFQAQRI